MQHLQNVPQQIDRLYRKAIVMWYGNTYIGKYWSRIDASLRVRLLLFIWVYNEEKQQEWCE
jgi:hypothetical protein